MGVSASQASVKLVLVVRAKERHEEPVNEVENKAYLARNQQISTRKELCQHMFSRCFNGFPPVP